MLRLENSAPPPITNGPNCPNGPNCLPSYSYCAFLKSIKLNEREEIGVVFSKKCSSSAGSP